MKPWRIYTLDYPIDEYRHEMGTTVCVARLGVHIEFFWMEELNIQKIWILSPGETRWLDYMGDCREVDL